MSDQACTIQIEFSIYDHTEKTTMRINWFCGEDGLDDRVREWFVEVHDRALAKTNSKNHHVELKARIAVLEGENRALENALLYPPPNAKVVAYRVYHHHGGWRDYATQKEAERATTFSLRIVPLWEIEPQGSPKEDGK